MMGIKSSSTGSILILALSLLAPRGQGEESSIARHLRSTIQHENSSILDIGHSDELRSKVLELESGLIDGGAAAMSAAQQLEQAVKDLRRANALERTAQDPRYIDGWLTLAVHAHDECEWLLGRRLATIVLRLFTSQMPTCASSKLEPSMAIRLGLPPSFLFSLAARSFACASLNSPQSLLPPFPQHPLGHGQPLRVGYLSSDFYKHKAGLLRKAIFQGSVSVHAHLFYTGKIEDEYTLYLRSPSPFRTFITLPEGGTNVEASSRVINAASIHILVDLNTHNRGGSLSITSLFSFKAVPMTVVYPDYPGTAGLNSKSLLISDRIVTPPETARFITESLLFLPTCYLLTDHRQSLATTQDQAYSGYLSREAANLPQLTKEEDSRLERKWNVCSPNAAGKADLLSALAMKQSLAMLAAEQSSQVNTSLLTFWIGPSHSREATQRFENLMRGVVGKVMVMGRESREAHVRRLAFCDLSLDSFSLSGIATGADALWAGSPLITRPGTSFGARVGASLAFHAGCTEIICRNAKDYAQITSLLLLSRQLKKVREKLFERGKRGPGLFDEEQWMIGWHKGLKASYELLEHSSAWKKVDSMHVIVWRK